MDKIKAQYYIQCILQKLVQLRFKNIIPSAETKLQEQRKGDPGNFLLFLKQKRNEKFLKQLKISEITTIGVG